MTVSYSLEAASAKSFRIHKLLLKWKGSVWQCVWKNLLLWLACYYLISVIYRYLLPLWPDSEKFFEDISVFCQRYTEFIPITFLLGFYVNFVIQRWWDQYTCLGWVNTPCLYIATFVRGTDETARIIRRSCARYLSLAQILLFRDISPVIRKRFPTTQHLIDANVMTEEESVSLDTLETPYHKYFVPIQWACTLLGKARDDGRIISDEGFVKMIKAVLGFRTRLGILFSYEIVSIPLVYTQVVALGVKSYFVICLLGRQYLNPSKGYANSEVDFYVPIFTIMQFMFYMGWLGVAEVLMNPLGEDDEDFETNDLITRNLQLGLTIVDDNFGVIPTLCRDAFWDDAKVELPHTVASYGKADHIPIGSCAELEVAQEDQKVFDPTETGRNSESEGHGFRRSLFRRRKSTQPASKLHIPSQTAWGQPHIISQTPSDAERQVNEELFYNHLPRFAKAETTPNMSRKRSRIAQEYLQRRQKRPSETQSDHKVPAAESNGETFPSPNSFVTRPKENDTTEPGVIVEAAAIGANDEAGFSSKLSVIDEIGESSRKESFVTTFNTAPWQPMAEVRVERAANQRLSRKDD